MKLQLLQWTHTLTLTTLRRQLPRKPVTAMLLARVLAPVARPAATMVSRAPLTVASRHHQNDPRMHLLYVALSLFFFFFRPHSAKQAPNPSAVLGVFGLSIRTQERDLDEEFSRFGRVEKVTIVYDQRVCPYTVLVKRPTLNPRCSVRPFSWLRLHQNVRRRRGNTLHPGTQWHR